MISYNDHIVKKIRKEREKEFNNYKENLSEKLLEILNKKFKN